MSIRDLVFDLNEEPGETTGPIGNTKAYKSDASKNTRTDGITSNNTVILSEMPDVTGHSDIFSNTFEDATMQTCKTDDNQLKNEVIESETEIYLEEIKEESCERHFYCDGCREETEEFCEKCSVLLRILHNPLSDTIVEKAKTAKNSLPKNLLRIEDTSNCFGVYALKTIPKDVIFGPYYGLTPIQSTTGCSWKMKAGTLIDSENSNWMRFIKFTENASHQNLMVFQYDGNLYYQSIRKINAGGELLAHYYEKRVKNSTIDEETYCDPIIKRELEDVYACTFCCLGFATKVHLERHKHQCPYIIDANKFQDIIQCAYCKIYLDRREYTQYHKNKCYEKHISNDDTLSDSSVSSYSSTKGSERTPDHNTEERKDDLDESKLLNEESNSKTDHHRKRSRHCCLFCRTPVLNFARHMRRSHKNETEVKKIFELPCGDSGRKKLLTALRKKGNYLNEYYKPARKSMVNGKLLPCSLCMGFYSATQLWRHRKRCKMENGSKLTSETSFQRVVLHIDAVLRRDVFPHMPLDNVSWAAKQDNLICAYGVRCIRIHRNKLSIQVAVRRMRELAKLLIEMKKIERHVESLLNMLQPKYFESMIKIINELSTSPSYIVSIILSLKECCQIAVNRGRRRKKESPEMEIMLKSTHQLLQSYYFDVSRLHPIDEDIHVENSTPNIKVTLITLADDLKTLQNYLDLKAKEAASKLTNDNNDEISYKLLLEVTFCRILLLNGLEPTELQSLLLSAFKQKNVKICLAKFNVIKMKLSQKFKRLKIDDTLILFNTVVQEHIDLMLRFRYNFFTQENVYLFAEKDSDGTISGVHIFRKHVKESAVKDASAIISKRYREEVTRLFQLFHMTITEIEELVFFMGSTIGIHLLSDSLLNNSHQIAKISKLVELMENGQAEEFRGKPLDKIDINLNYQIPYGIIPMSNNSGVFTNYSSTITKKAQKSKEKDENSAKIDVKKSPDSKPSTVNNNRERTTATGLSKRRILVPWTPEQKKVVMKFFERHIKDKKPPRKYECDRIIKQNPAVLSNKDWLKIKVFVQNVYTKQ